jgi:ubiquinone/menaquinone biosynthesis C-methylase UbiE
MDPKIKSDDIQHFDQWAPTYDRTPGQFFVNFLHNIVLDTISRHLERSPESILDVGCGTGRLLRKARQRWPGVQLFGIDPSIGMLEVARHLTPGATFYESSAENLPLTDSSVNVILSTISFHHWIDQAAGVQEIARVLRPNGLFCLADAITPFWLSIFFHHFDRNNSTEWETIFAQAGLKVIVQERKMTGFILLLLGMKQ